MVYTKMTVGDRERERRSSFHLINHGEEFAGRLKENGFVPLRIQVFKLRRLDVNLSTVFKIFK